MSSQPTSTLAGFRTPPRILIPKLVRSRAAWKAKVSQRQQQRKLLLIRVRDRTASRLRHRQRGEGLAEQREHVPSPTRIHAAAVESPAPFADQERAFDNLRIALEEIHYLHGDRADALMHGLRPLLGRAWPTAMEVRLLLGLARQIRWYVRQRADGSAPQPDEG